METMVISDITELIAIRSAARTGRPTRRKLLVASDGVGRLRPATRPITRKTKTGKPTVPNAPSGSRMKTLISIQVSFQSPRNIISLVANRTASQFEKHVLEVGDDHAEVSDAYTALGQTVDHLGHQIVAAAANRKLQIATHHRLNSRNCAKAFLGRRVIGSQDDGSFGAMPINKSLRSVDVDNSAAFDDCNAVAQALRFFHQMSCQKDGLAAFANAAHQFPDGASRLWIQAGGELVEEHNFRIVDQREGDEEALLLASREIHEPGVALVGKAGLIEQALGVCRLFLVERSPQVHGFPNFYPLLKLRLLELHADAVLQFVDLTEGIET